MGAGAGEAVVGPVVGKAINVRICGQQVVGGGGAAHPAVGVVGEVGGDEVVVAIEYLNLALPYLALVNILAGQVVGGAGERVRTGKGEGVGVGARCEARCASSTVYVILGAEPFGLCG